jgi:hypothetical protein
MVVGMDARFIGKIDGSAGLLGFGLQAPKKG